MVVVSSAGVCSRIFPGFSGGEVSVVFNVGYDCGRLWAVFVVIGSISFDLVA
jgi:hypothetical protein